ncbi:ADP-ribosylation factor, Arf Arf6 [Balamuthia mandrillaris]
MGNAFKKIFGNKEARLLVLGLDNAGKTTIIHALNGEEDFKSNPTLSFSVETIEINRITLHIWDVGGQNKHRQLWRHYFMGTSALIFVIDSTDSERFDVAREEFLKVVTDSTMQASIVLILANKCDCEGAASEEELSQALLLSSSSGDILQGRLWRIQRCSARTGEGLEEGFRWVSDALAKPPSKRKDKQKKGNH